MSAAGRVRKRVLLRGRVQGVGFRFFVFDLGQAMGIDGWVRNLPDGRTVEVVAEAEPSTLQRFLDAVRRGPPGALVTEFEEREEPGGEALHGFRVTR
jgi:acylphosphatase